MKKRGFEMIWSTWVIMIIAVVLLIFILTFFAFSSGSFVNSIQGFFSKTNVDSVVKGCNILVDSGNKYEFCCDKKEVKYTLDGELKSGEFNCYELMNKTFINNEIKTGISCEAYNC